MCVQYFLIGHDVLFVLIIKNIVTGKKIIVIIHNLLELQNLCLGKVLERINSMPIWLNPRLNEYFYPTESDPIRLSHKDSYTIQSEVLKQECQSDWSRNYVREGF